MKWLPLCCILSGCAFLDGARTAIESPATQAAGDVAASVGGISGRVAVVIAAGIAGGVWYLTKGGGRG